MLLQVFMSLLIFGSVFWLVWVLFRFPVAQEASPTQKLSIALGAAERKTIYENPLLGPVMLVALQIARRFDIPGLRQRIREDLGASGNPDGYTVDEYLALSLAGAAAAGLLMAVLGMLLIQQFLILFVAAAVVLGFYGPLIVLKNAARDRLSRISKRLPYSLDLISLMMQAGSTFSEAIATLIKDEPDEDLNRELRIVQAEIDYGTARSLALRNMANRISLDSLRSVVGAINQAEDLGTPLSSILKSQAGMLRMYRSVRAEKLAASASLRILIPSVLIVIAVLLTVFGPLIVGGMGPGQVTSMSNR